MGLGQHLVGVVVAKVGVDVPAACDQGQAVHGLGPRSDFAGVGDVGRIASFKGIGHKGRNFLIIDQCGGRVERC